MIVFLERKDTAVDLFSARLSSNIKNHVGEDEDRLELGHLRDRRALGCRPDLPGYSRRAEAGGKPHRGSDAPEPGPGGGRKSATDRPREGRPPTRAGCCVPSTSARIARIEPGRAAPRAATDGDNARRKQDVSGKPTERPGGIASTGLLPWTRRWNFRGADACCDPPFSEQHRRQEHRLLDCR